LTRCSLSYDEYPICYFHGQIESGTILLQKLNNKDDRTSSYDISDPITIHPSSNHPSLQEDIMDCHHTNINIPINHDNVNDNHNNEAHEAHIHTANSNSRN
jgi:hypothetical protein